MMIEFAIAMALQERPVETPCEKLARDFAKNEVTYTIIYDTNQELLRSDENFAKATGNYSRISQRLATNAVIDEKFKTDGDRITSLVAGHGCRLPDHVTNPQTYRADLAACTAAKDTAHEETACGYIDRAVALAAPTATRPIVRQHKR